MNGISSSYSPNVYPANHTYIQDNSKTKEQEKPQMLVERRLGAVKMPKASTLRTFLEKIEAKFEKWLSRYNSRPHRYNTDRMQDTADMILDLTDNKNDKHKPNQPAAISLRA